MPNAVFILSLVICLDPPAQVILGVGAQILEQETGDCPTIVNGAILYYSLVLQKDVT